MGTTPSPEQGPDWQEIWRPGEFWRGPHRGVTPTMPLPKSSSLHPQEKLSKEWESVAWVPPNRPGSVQGCLRPSPGPEDQCACLPSRQQLAGEGTSASLGIGGHRDGTLGFLYSPSAQGAFVG